MTFNPITPQNMNSNQESSFDIIDRASKLNNPSTPMATKSFLNQSNTQENIPIRTRMRSVNQEEPVQNRIKTMIKQKDNSKSNHSKSEDKLQEKIFFENSNLNVSDGSINCILLEKVDSLSEEINSIQHHHQSVKQIINCIGFDTMTIEINKSEKLICSVSNCKASFNQKRYIQRHESLHSDLNKNTKFNCQCGRRFLENEELIKHSILGICYGSITRFR